MAMTLREQAMAAVREADAPKRAEEERLREQAENHKRRFRYQTTEMTESARKAIYRTFGINTEGWEPLEEHPTLTVLRDPHDSRAPFLGNAPLTLVVQRTPQGNFRIMYCPYKGYLHSLNRHTGTRDAWDGREVTDMLSLGRAIQEHDAHERAVYASMPTHLP